MTTTQHTSDPVSIAWPVLTPVIIVQQGCEIVGPRDELLAHAPDVTTYGYIVDHLIHNDERMIVVRMTDDVDEWISVESSEDGTELAAYAMTIEKDGVTEAFPSDALAAWESNPEHFGDLTNDLVADGSIWPL